MTKRAATAGKARSTKKSGETIGAIATWGDTTRDFLISHSRALEIYLCVA